MTARRRLSASLVTGLFVLAVPAFVTAVDAKTTRKPKGATAQCEDGSYSHAKTQQGACSSHGGVKTWYGDSAAASTPTAPSSKMPTSTSRAARPPRASASTPVAPPTGAAAQCKD